MTVTNPKICTVISAVLLVLVMDSRHAVDAHPALTRTQVGQLVARLTASNPAAAARTLERSSGPVVRDLEYALNASTNKQLHRKIHAIFRAIMARNFPGNAAAWEIQAYNKFRKQLIATGSKGSPRSLMRHSNLHLLRPGLPQDREGGFCFYLTNTVRTQNFDFGKPGHLTQTINFWIGAVTDPSVVAEVCKPNHAYITAMTDRKGRSLLLPGDSRSFPYPMVPYPTSPEFLKVPLRLSAHKIIGVLRGVWPAAILPPVQFKLRANASGAGRQLLSWVRFVYTGLKLFSTGYDVRVQFRLIMPAAQTFQQRNRNLAEAQWLGQHAALQLVDRSGKTRTCGISDLIRYNKNRASVFQMAFHIHRPIPKHLRKLQLRFIFHPRVTIQGVPFEFKNVPIP